MVGPRSLASIFAAVRHSGSKNDVSLAVETKPRAKSSGVVPHPLTQSGSFLELPELLPRNGVITEL